jgi:16S rRNA (cytosine1402-N4)-methyltransferase
MNSTYHEPVMLKACLEALNIQSDGVYVDVTFGGGGHSRAIMEKIDHGKLIAFDQDSDVLGHLPDDDRFEFVHHNYRFIRNFLKFQNNLPVDGILADLGISGHQIDEGARGFSYRFDAPLDMRMSKGISKTAADVLQQYTVQGLTNIFREYGELPKAFAMATHVVRERESKPIKTTGDLKEVLGRFAPAYKDLRFWSQVFQALRIEVNQELESLKRFLEQTPEVLRKGGRLVVLTYHSLEDRLVKQFIQHGTFDTPQDADIFGNRKLPFKAVNKKPLEPEADEIARNPRSRSAKLRIAERL